VKRKKETYRTYLPFPIKGYIFLISPFHYKKENIKKERRENTINGEKEKGNQEYTVYRCNNYSSEPGTNNKIRS
jgi:hypothetical protein